MRWFQTLILLVVLVLPAVAGREINNRAGIYNGDYIAATIAVREPDKDEVIKKTINISLRERYVDIIWSEEKMDRCRVDMIYTTGYKTEITARHAEKDIRYFITIEGTIGPSQ